MKIIKTILVSLLVISCTAQQKDMIPDEYVIVGYSSICCGPPSSEPVKNFLQDYAKKNNLPKFVVSEKTGLGREGEFELHIGIKKMMKNKKEFLEQLNQVIDKQNNSRSNNDGFVSLEEKIESNFSSELKK